MNKPLMTFFVAIIITSFTGCSDSGTGTENTGGNEETNTFMVSVDINPSNSGSISPAADSTYNEGENIDLQAIPKEGYVFTTWAGDVTSTDSSLSLTVDKDYNLTANFELKSYELVITTEGEGTVNEKVVQQKSQDYDHGTIVELTANPAQGYKFKEWKGDITGSENPVEITIDDPKDVTAVFQKVTYALNLNITGQGSIVKDPDQQEYEYGSTVNLTASPATGWEFVEWQGDATGTDSTIQLTIDQAKNITAVFVEYSQNQFYLAENGVTIKCEDADIGETGTVNGVTYTKRTTGYLSPITINNAATSCTSGIINMDELFYYERHFNADISHWDVSSVTSMEAMFRDAWDFNQDISHWDVSSVTNMSSMFDNTTAFNIDISSWNVSSVNDMTFMFVDTDSFDVDLGNWDVSSVTNMNGMFQNAKAFNGDLNNWNVSGVTDMSRMFYEAEVFNGNISSWDVSSVTNMQEMFRLATNFNSDLSNWNVANVEDFTKMFNRAEAFNSDLNNWDISSATTIYAMFRNAKSFNSNLNNWDVSALESMKEVFYWALAFNGDISNWDVSNVKRMDELFLGAKAFNRDISNWDVSNVTNMNSMFQFAESFNHNISVWDVSNVYDMTYMFYQAKSFDKDLSSWCVSNISSYPSDFSTGTLLQSSDLPVWGTCPQ